jgi:hypothetical protein
MINKRFGRLVVTARVEGAKPGEADLRCRCNCGTEITTPAWKLQRGYLQSCGCADHKRAFSF